MAALTIHATFTGARELAERLDRMDVAQDTADTVEAIGKDAVRCLQLAAPEKTGRLKRSIQYRTTGRMSGEVFEDARNPDSGYLYGPVTRFGHGPIVPKHASLDPKRRPALRFVIAGRVVYVKSVKAWRPPGGDWVDKADGPIRDAVRLRAVELRVKLIRQITGR